MKLAALFLVLLVVGVFMALYIVNSQALINWNVADTYLNQQVIVTQVEAETFLAQYYQRGLLFNLLNKRSLLGLVLSSAFIVAGVFGLLHLLIDKLFFKKFYEPPNYVAAIRRAVWLSTLPTALAALLLFNYWSTQLALLTLVLYAVIEIILTQLFAARAARNLAVGRPKDTVLKKNTPLPDFRPAPPPPKEEEIKTDPEPVRINTNMKKVKDRFRD